MSIIEQIDTTAKALRDDFLRASERAADLKVTVKNSEQVLRDATAEAESHIGEAFKAMDQLEEEFVAATSPLAAEFEKLSQEFTQAVSRLDTVQDHLRDKGAAAATLVTELLQTTDTWITAVTAEQGELEEAIRAKAAAAQEAIQQDDAHRADMLQVVEALSQRVGEAKTEWTEHVETLGNELKTALEECSATIDGELISPMNDALSQFETLMHEVQQNGLAAPLDQLRQEAEADISTAIQSVVADAVQRITDALTGLIHSISDAKERSSAEENALREIFEQLRPVFDQIVDKARGVEGIANAVGVNT